MREHLLKLADNLDALGHEKHADLITNFFLKIADTLSDLKYEWANKGYYPYNPPYRGRTVGDLGESASGEDTYQKFKHSKTGEIVEVMLPRASTAPKTDYRAAPEAMQKPIDSEQLKPAPEPTLLESLTPAPFQKYLDAISMKEIKGLLISTADSLDSIGRGRTANDVDQLLLKISQELEMKYQDEKPTTLTQEQIQDEEEWLDSGVPQPGKKPVETDIQDIPTTTAHDGIPLGPMEEALGTPEDYKAKYEWHPPWS